ncbi:MAG: PaaR repeat-containing protein [Idiomarinaceae bacterium]|nr:PaaR repeat-containing protein [Idiomarinaceae bacterium]
MGNATARVGDSCTGHGDKGPRPIVEGSGDVFINGQPVARVGDDLADHGHDGPLKKISSGSSTVFVNGQPVARIGDDVECGSILAEGSDNVFTG